MLAAQEASREGEGGRNTGGGMKELRKRRERGEENVCEKRMRADRASRFYSGLEMHGWHVCTEFSVACLITLIGYVGAMVQYPEPRKYILHIWLLLAQATEELRGSFAGRFALHALR